MTKPWMIKRALLFAFIVYPLTVFCSFFSFSFLNTAFAPYAGTEFHWWMLIAGVPAAALFDNICNIIRIGWPREQADGC